MAEDKETVKVEDVVEELEGVKLELEQIKSERDQYKAAYEQLVEQNAKAALSIADRAYVLETGKISLSGDAKVLMNDDSVKKSYLGE